jgi:hypothetical protein
MGHILTKNTRFQTIEGLNDLADGLEDAGDKDAAELLELAVLFIRAVPEELLSDEIVTEELPSDMAGLRRLCEEMRNMQIKLADLKAQTTEVRIPFDIIRTKTIPETMEALEVKTATFTGLGRVQLAADLRCSTKKGEKFAAMEWLRDCGYQDMITEGYNASSMKALVRQMIVDGTEPPSFLNVLPFTRASIVKA